MQDYIGRFARSVECGWLGKVVGVETMNGHPMLRMLGVNELVRAMIGGDLDDLLDEDDVQWFAPEDVRFLRLV